MAHLPHALRLVMLLRTRLHTALRKLAMRHVKSELLLLLQIAMTIPTVAAVCKVYN